VQNEVEHRGVQDGLETERLARGRRSGEDEDAGADDGADPERGEAPRPQRPPQPALRILEAAISASMLFVRKMPTSAEPTAMGPGFGIGAGADGRKPADRLYRLRCPCAWWRTFFFMEPRATPLARLALGGAALRTVLFLALRSALSVMFLVFISFFSALRIFPPAS